MDLFLKTRKNTAHKQRLDAREQVSYVIKIGI
jgi:hypothetical protein